jgi:type IV fimbrial biogenesis protein FimT
MFGIRFRSSSDKAGRSPQRPRCRIVLTTIQFDQGFTLIELLITLTIVVVILVIGIPSYKGVISINNVSAEINTLVGDLQFARSEAIKRGQAVSVCAAATSGAGPYTCSGSSTWTSGWIVLLSGTTTVLRVQAPLAATAGSMVSGSNPALNRVDYNSFGFSTARGSITVAPPSGLGSKTACISVVGNIQSVDGEDGQCP